MAIKEEAKKAKATVKKTVKKAEAEFDSPYGK